MSWLIGEEQGGTYAVVEAGVEGLGAREERGRSQGEDGLDLHLEG